MVGNVKRMIVSDTLRLMREESKDDCSLLIANDGQQWTLTGNSRSGKYNPFAMKEGDADTRVRIGSGLMKSQGDFSSIGFS